MEGEDRYVPGSGSKASGDMQLSGTADPFTGATSYRPSNSASSVISNTATDPFTGLAPFSYLSPKWLSYLYVCLVTDQIIFL